MYVILHDQNATEIIVFLIVLLWITNNVVMYYMDYLIYRIGIVIHADYIMYWSACNDKKVID